MEVTAGYEPELSFQWVPAGCQVYEVTVDQNGSIRWDLKMLSLQNSIASPVVYGAGRAGAVSSQPAPFAPGAFHVRLSRIDDQYRIYTAAKGTFTVGSQP